MSDTATETTPDAPALGREQLRAKAKKTFAPSRLDVPEWGGAVYVARLSAAGLDLYQEAVHKAATAEARAVVLAHVLTAEDGTRLYDPARPGDVAELAGLDAAGAERVRAHFSEVNGLAPKR